METHSSSPSSHKPVVALLAVLLVAYAVATAAGWTNTLGHGEQAAEHAEATSHVEGQEPEGPLEQVSAHYWAVIPFTLLLGCIAVLPLLEGPAHWWEHNLNKFYVAANLGLITLLYIAFLHPQG